MSKYKHGHYELTLVEDQTYPADLVWTASWTAFRMNGFEYIREYQNSQDTTKVVNRLRINDILAGKIELSEEDHLRGLAMREFNKRFVMIALSRQLNSFEQLVSEVVLKDQVEGKDIRIISSLCEAFHRECIRLDKAAAIVKLADGKHVGIVNTRITANLIVIHSYMSQKYQRFFNLGDLDGSLVAWWSDYPSVINANIMLTARVKEHTSWNGDGGPVPLTKFSNVRQKRMA